jgi:hypothetical protein
MIVYTSDDELMKAAQGGYADYPAFQRAWSPPLAHAILHRAQRAEAEAAALRARADRFRAVLAAWRDADLLNESERDECWKVTMAVLAQADTQGEGSHECK